MDIFATIGVIGGLLFFAKVFIHVFLVYATTGKFPLYIGAYTPLNYFGPIVRNVEKKYQPFKLIANVMYWTSLVLIVVFLIDHNVNHRPE